MADDIKHILKALRAIGWRLEKTKNGHWKAYPPDRTKEAVTLPSTPGRGRAIANTIAQLRRSGFEWPPKKGHEK